MTTRSGCDAADDAVDARRGPRVSDHRAVLARVGIGVFQVAYVCQQFGWQTPAGAFPYFHVDTPAVDLARWTAGDLTAGARLLRCVPDWRPFLDCRPPSHDPHQASAL